jgi:hypothetical protein
MTTSCRDCTSPCAHCAALQTWLVHTQCNAPDAPHASSTSRACLPGTHTHSHTQEEVLSRLKGVSHIVQMVGRCSCNYDNAAWTALLLEPFVEHLSHCDSLLVTTQVRWDAQVVLHINGLARVDQTCLLSVGSSLGA